jgi:NDP-sugar pyrophosphorylase family protein
MPKPLVPVVDRPVLSWVIDGLTNAGFTSIGITTGYLGAAVEEYVRTAHGATPDISFLREPTLLGTGGTLRRHRDFFGGDPALVVTADMLTDVSLRAMADRYERRPVSACIAVTDQDGRTWPGDITVTDGPHTTGYRFKPGATPGTVRGSAGTWIIDPSVLELVPEDEFVDFSRDVLPRLPHESHSLDAYYQPGCRVLDVGTFPSLRDANFEMVRDRGLVAFVSPEAIVPASVEIVPPVVIGTGAEIGEGAVIVRSVVLPGGRVPDHAVVAEAVVAPYDPIP